MATVVNKAAPDGNPAFADFFTSLEANTPDFPAAQWVRNSPNLAALIGNGSANSPEVPKLYWIVDPPASQNLREMTPAEQDAANIAPDNLTAARANKKQELENTTFGYILTRYPSATYEGLMLISQQANGQRRAYLVSWFDWSQTVYQELADTEDIVDALDDVTDIEAVTIDLTPFNGTDPLVTIQGAMSL